MIGQPKTSDIVQRTIDFFNQLSSTSYAVFDNNYKYLYDKYNDVYRYLPCNGDMAGLVLSTTLNQERLYTPAGFNRGQLRNAIKAAYSPLKDHRDRLYAARINPIVSFPGEGIVLFGDKTALGYQSAFDRINVRRLFLVIEEAISDAAKTQLFELNDEFTRQQFKNIVGAYLRSVQSRRGIVDYLVVCDGTNNPAEAIDRGELRRNLCETNSLYQLHHLDLHSDKNWCKFQRARIVNPLYQFLTGDSNNGKEIKL